MTLRQYRDRLNKHDWFYMMSDDRRIYESGKANETELQKLAKTDSNFQKAYDSKYKSVVKPEK